MGSDKARGYAAMAAALGMLTSMERPPHIVIRPVQDTAPDFVSIKDDKRKRKSWLQRQARKHQRKHRK